MNDLPIFLITALAVWRVSHMLAKEDGPWGIFFHARTGLGARFDTGTMRWESDNVFGEMLICPLCLSVGIAVLAMAVLNAGGLPFGGWFGGREGLGVLLWWLGLSGAASALELLVKDD